MFRFLNFWRDFESDVSRRWRGLMTMSDRGQIYKLARLNFRAPCLASQILRFSDLRMLFAGPQWTISTYILESFDTLEINYIKPENYKIKRIAHWPETSHDSFHTAANYLSTTSQRSLEERVIELTGCFKYVDDTTATVRAEQCIRHVTGASPTEEIGRAGILPQLPRPGSGKYWDEGQL